MESVSVWIVGGEREVTETEADEWEARITDFVGAGRLEMRKYRREETKISDGQRMGQQSLCIR